ncbi:MAG: HAMP domain-containing histidine kinase [Verrucomicrobia bacterium]|nr:HAMP domain-containing histidine kinase [Verrucomicrobiota bacterium]
MSHSVLVLAPVGNDAAGAIKVLQNAGISAKPCQNISHVCDLLRMEGDSIWALVLTEEALVSPKECSNLTDWIEHQEPWSELPVVFLTHPGQPTAATWKRSRVLSSRGAPIILERPVRPSTLIAALRVALGSRERQYKLRDLLQSQHRAGIELLRARLEAETANRAKDQFLATLSHELRTPLNAISGWTYLMKNERKDEAVIKQGLEVVQRNTNALIGLISDLLDTAKINAGTLTMEFKEIDLQRVIKASVETFRVQAALNGISLTSAVTTTKAGNFSVWGDEAKLDQVLGNLLSNALKFTPSGGVVTVELSKAPATAVIVVKDSGRGVSREFLPHIFKRFSQDKVNYGEGGGLGLGLAICEHLVELHGGSISAESAGLGHGTTIKVELPTISAKFEPIVGRGKSQFKENRSDL